MKKISILVIITTLMVISPFSKSSAHSIGCLGLNPAHYGGYSWHETTVHWSFIEQMVETCRSQGGYPVATYGDPQTVPHFDDGIDY